MTGRSATVELHPAALRNNLAVARGAAPTARVMACVKAEGYGHGLEFVAAALSPETDAFAVACVGEGVALRQCGCELPICILNGPADRGELSSAVEHRLDLVVHQRWHLEALAELPAQAAVGVWLKLNSGMGRVGIPAEETRDWYHRLYACPAVASPIGFMTHMARADDRGDDFTARQWQRFCGAIEGLPGPRSVANSGSVLAFPETHAEWVRPGIMLYGCSPFVEGPEPALGLQPAMTLSAPLIAINELAAGEPIGYGSSWVTPEPMPVGVVGIGYGDGYPRTVGNGTPVVINGRRAPIVGRVSMDKITVDLRDTPAEVGDRVTLWGQGLPVEEIAQAAGTIGYELLCSVFGRVAVQQ